MSLIAIAPWEKSLPKSNQKHILVLNLVEESTFRDCFIVESRLCSQIRSILRLQEVVSQSKEPKHPIYRVALTVFITKKHYKLKMKNFTVVDSIFKEGDSVKRFLSDGRKKDAEWKWRNEAGLTDRNRAKYWTSILSQITSIIYKIRLQN